MNFRTHAENELKAAGYDLDSTEDGPNKWMAQNVLELIDTFAKQGHSGSSAPYAISLFSTLAKYEPLGPLTGADSEWVEVGEGVFQNKRCSHVFKQADRFNGQAYDIDGIVWREPGGACFTNYESMVPVVFPYTPKTEYRDRAASGSDSDELSTR